MFYYWLQNNVVENHWAIIRVMIILKVPHIRVLTEPTDILYQRSVELFEKNYHKFFNYLEAGNVFYTGR